MATIQKGATAYCIFEHRIKPFDVQVAKIVDVRPSRGFGLTEVELDNGIVFKGSNSKSQFLYEDKDRIPGAPAKPTRAQVVIFVDYNLAVRHLSNRSAAKLIPLLNPIEKAKQEEVKEETKEVKDIKGTTDYKEQMALF